MKIGVWIWTVVFTCLAFVGCGSDSGAAYGDENGSEHVSLFDTLMVQGVGDLPACDGGR